MNGFLVLIEKYTKTPYTATAKAQQLARRILNVIKKADQLARLR